MNEETKSSLNEFLTALAVVVLLVLVSNPFDFWMSSALYMILSGALAIAVLFFVIFVWREKAIDEREARLRLQSGRFAYLLGASVILVGVIFQTFTVHHVDPWLSFALVAMVLGKIVASAYGRKNN